MEKYIRTKDGRIIGVGAVTLVEGEKTKDYILDKIENVDGKCCLHWTAAETRGDHYIEQIGFCVYIDSPFIKQSDKIEELCDEFVGVDKTCENGHQLLRAIPYKCAKFWNGGVYGAIWTKWGLKYIAKLNADTGEFELLKQERKND